MEDPTPSFAVGDTAYLLIDIWARQPKDVNLIRCTIHKRKCVSYRWTYRVRVVESLLRPLTRSRRRRIHNFWHTTETGGNLIDPESASVWISNHIDPMKGTGL